MFTSILATSLGFICLKAAIVPSDKTKSAGLDRFFFKPKKNRDLSCSRSLSQVLLAFILLWLITPLRPRPIVVELSVTIIQLQIKPHTGRLCSARVFFPCGAARKKAFREGRLLHIFTMRCSVTPFKVPEALRGGSF